MERKEIVLMKFGSHLYGTDTEESDLDYRGVFMPNTKDVLLGRIPKTIQSNTKIGDGKNTKEDIDTELYSLHYFIDLACQGQTVALDMLHAPTEMIIKSNYIWDRIIQQRERFYTKNLSAFIGYARKQAAKYGIKGSRLSDAKKVMGALSPDKHVNDACSTDMCLTHMWDFLPTGEHIDKLERDIYGYRVYQVCGKKFGERCKVDYVYEIVKKFHDNYGERAKMAERNEGIDWKAMSHALRAAYQVESILTKGTIEFPLPQADILRNIKQGKIQYRMVADILEALMIKLELLVDKSLLPTKVNRKFWEEFIVCEMLGQIQEEEG